MSSKITKTMTKLNLTSTKEWQETKQMPRKKKKQRRKELFEARFGSIK